MCYSASIHRLLLVRHGQSTWNLAGRVQGQVMEVPLTELGVEQAQLAGQTITDHHPQYIVSSDQLRARQSAQIIAGYLGLTIHYDSRLREQNLGSMEGKFSKQLHPEPTPEGIDITQVRWAGGESVEDVFDRLKDFLSDLSDVASPTVIVSHGQTLACLATLIEGGGPTDVEWSRFKNGQVRVFDWQINRAI